MTGTVVDYDANGYDYRDYWTGREYENWAESRALRRLLAQLPAARWLADFGGGFGRNVPHYLSRARHSVLVDYSATNLANAAGHHVRALAQGRLHLVRCDLAALAFRDFAFDAAIVVRVLHHLHDLDGALAEMGRTVGSSWVLDVPIKHHALGVVRAARRGQLHRVRDPSPMLVGREEPYWNYHLDAVRARLRRLGWRPVLAASVNNVRRWDRLVPARWLPLAAPLARGVEVLGQVAGKGWWGPSQLLAAHRYDAVRLPEAPRWPGTRGDGDVANLPPGLRGLARRMVCPACVRGLKWTPDEAYCDSCGVGYRRRDGYWDFVAARPGPRVG